MNRLQAYSQILRAWSVLKAERLVERSAKVFQWVQANLKPQLTNQTIQSDPTKLVVSLADFMNTKTKLGHLRAHYVGVFKSEYASKELLRSIEQLKLLDMRQIEEKLKSDQSLAVPLVEEQEKKLKFFQLQQKKKEAYQIVKFISVEREERRNNGVGYSSQVSFRVPFLSDSEELRRAKADFASANSDFELSKLKEKRELLELKSETLGLIEKYKILTMLPKTSFSMKKIKNKIASVPEVARGEAEYLDAQIDLIETRSLIFQHYLLYLAKSRQLGSKSVNYLTQRIPNR